MGTTRRTFLAGAAVASLPVAVAAAPVEEFPAQKASRLAAELSDTLNDYMDGEFKAVVEPSETSKFPVLFQRRKLPQVSPERRVVMAIEELKAALSAYDPTIGKIFVSGPDLPGGEKRECRFLMTAHNFVY